MSQIIGVKPKHRRMALSRFKKLMQDESVRSITMEIEFDQPLWLDDGSVRVPLSQRFIGAVTTFTVHHVVKMGKGKRGRKPGA